MEIIKIFEHKPFLMDDEVVDYMRVKEIAFATINENYATIQNGPLQLTKIPIFSRNYRLNPYAYKIATINLLAASHENNSADYILKRTIEEDIGKYYRVDTFTFNGEKQVGLRDIDDSELIAKLDELFGVQSKENKDETTEEIAERFIEYCKTGSKVPFHLSGDEVTTLLGEKVINDSPGARFLDLNSIDINSKYQQMKEVVFGQDEQVKSILANLTTNLRIANSEIENDIVADLKNTILLVGATGTGKTLIIETLAKLLDIPYIIEDANRYTRVGYQGEDVENMLINLYHVAGDDIEKASRGIIFIDEFDKVCNEDDERAHAATIDVQQSLLKIIEGTTIHKKIHKNFSEEDFVFDTHRLTFVLSGAFEELGEIKEYITDKGLIEYGLIRELARRISLIIEMNKPTKEMLKDALVHSRRSYLNEFKEYLQASNIKMDFTDDYLDYVVECAMNSEAGFSGLKKTIIKDINEQLFDIIAGNSQVLKLVRKEIEEEQK